MIHIHGGNKQTGSIAAPGRLRQLEHADAIHKGSAPAQRDGQLTQRAPHKRRLGHPAFRGGHIRQGVEHRHRRAPEAPICLHDKRREVLILRLAVRVVLPSLLAVSSRRRGAGLARRRHDVGVGGRVRHRDVPKRIVCVCVCASVYG
jgi:hypothetical protein